MSFIVRPVRENDLNNIFDLSSQFVLLNLPANKEMLKKKISKSLKSFSGELSKDAGAEYLFVLESLEDAKLIGCSMILAKHGSEETPHYCFKVLKQEMHSEDLGIGFIHHVLRLSAEMDGPTEIGGLVLDSEFRSNPLKLGKLISFARFLFIARNKEKFQKKLLCEFAPLLTADGKSHLWEELGRKFTGLTYEEADRLSLKNKEFIRQLFPIEDIYLALMSPEVRLNLGKVSESTEPAKHLLGKIGFRYLNEIDPFDGGPHYGANVDEVSLVRDSFHSKIEFHSSKLELVDHIVAFQEEDSFVSVYAKEEDGKLLVDSSLKESLSKFENKDAICVKL